MTYQLPIWIEAPATEERKQSPFANQNQTLDQYLVTMVETFDKRFDEGKFEEISTLLEQVDPTTLPPRTLTSILMTTNVAKHLLPSRTTFAQKAGKYLEGISSPMPQGLY
jgi:hypothetical protein